MVYTESIMEQKTVGIIGSGFGGLGLACMLAKKGYKVEVFEKNETLGGRARVFTEDGFTFDMGPSWYMMPEVFEHFFGLLGKKVEDLYTLKKLSPSYRVFFKDEKAPVDLYSDTAKNKELFESLEPGAGAKLDIFLRDTKFQYEVAYNEFMFKNYNNIFDFMNRRVMEVGRKLPLLKSQKAIVNKLFKNEILRRVMQYQTLLVGTAPKETPGIYTLMNYVDLVEGEWYPDGGIGKVPEALVATATELGVIFHTHKEAEKILVEKGIVKGIRFVGGEEYMFDIVVSNADIAHTNMVLLDEEYRTKSPKYWDKRRLAPSAFIMYLGVDGEIPELTHHNLLSAIDWDKNFDQLTTHPAWPEDPSLYICNPSKSDANVAPAGKENLFVLVPVAPGMEYTDAFEADYADFILTLIEKTIKIPNFKNRIVYKKIYAIKDFAKDYNAFKGTALGLAHTIGQTAIFRPNNINKKVQNLYYVGAGTNPGIGMPICLISAELAYKRIVGDTSVSPLAQL